MSKNVTQMNETELRYAIAKCDKAAAHDGAYYANLFDNIQDGFESVSPAFALAALPFAAGVELFDLAKDEKSNVGEKIVLGSMGTMSFALSAGLAAPFAILVGPPILLTSAGMSVYAKFASARAAKARKRKAEYEAQLEACRAQTNANDEERYC